MTVTAMRLRTAATCAVFFLLIVGLLSLTTSPSAADDATDAPSGLTVNGLGTPLDLDIAPRFGWHVNTAEQTAYEIRVSRDPGDAAAGDVWSSGRVESDEQNGIAYPGGELAPADRFVWVVRTWDGDGVASDWSAPAAFGTGPGTAWSDSKPIWASGAENWGDYTLAGSFIIEQDAASITFRATSAGDYYLWQFRADTNTLKTHNRTSVIDEIDLDEFDITLEAGEEYAFEIEAIGATVRTFIDGTLVRTFDNHISHPTGGFGFRTGRSEQASFGHITVTDPDDRVLYDNDFTGENLDFPSLEHRDDRLFVGTSKNEVMAGTWANYTLSASLTIDETAVGLRFRGPDERNSYMWQFRADNRLVPHKQVDGVLDADSVIKNVVLPAGTLAAGRTVDVRIEAAGSTIRTYIDEVLVDTTVDAQFARGGVGVRTGNTESGSIEDLRVENTQGETLLATTFPDGDRSLACGTAANGRLQVPRATACLNSGLSADWAFVRTEFDLPDREIAWASVYATGTDPRSSKQHVYKLYLNDEFVLLGPTQPMAGESRYDGYDVTDLLEPGASNTLAATLYTSADQKFQAELHVTYADGGTEVIGTDETWTALNGSEAFPAAGSIGTGFYRAPKEYFDARAFPEGFTATGFDDAAWPQATVKSTIPDLRGTPMDKVRHQRHAPVEIVQKGPGHYFIDFGRTWVGGLDWDVAEGIDGEQIDVRFGETTTAEHTVRYNLHAGNQYREFYTMRDGEQNFQTFGMRVFRYVEVIGAPEPITPENFQALALVYPFDRDAATFESSSDNLNAVWDLSRNTIEALNVNFYVDTWTRERINYEADAYLQQMSSLYLMDDLSLGIYSMDFFKTNRTWPTEWPLYVILSVHDAWRQTGQTEQLHHYYDNLKSKLPEQWYEESTGLIRKVDGSNGCNSRTDCDIVDWPVSQRDDYQFRQYNTVINALSYRAYRDMAAIATEIGEDEDAAGFTARAENIREAMNERLYDAEGGRYHDGMAPDGTLTTNFSIHASAFSLAFGVPTDEETERVSDFVASKDMACSVYCAPFVLNGLYDARQGQAALDLLTSESITSWMNMIDLGAGATMESWDPSMKSNITFSHPWAASPAFMVPSGVFGIQSVDPGYETFRVRPQPGDLEWGAITVPTVRGTVGTAFNRGDDGGFRLAVDVPGNTRAALSIPVDDDAEGVYVNGEPFTVEPEDGYATVEVGAGCAIVTDGPAPDALSDALLLGVCESDPVVVPDVALAFSIDAVDGWHPVGVEASLTTPTPTDLEYRLDEGEWTDYAGPIVFDEELSATLEYRVTLPGGQYGPIGSADVRTDGTPPTVRAEVDEERQATIDAEDERSGVEAIEYRLDGGSWVDYAEAFAVGAEATVIDYRATDRVGNVSAVSTLLVPADGDGGAVEPPVVEPVDESELTEENRGSVSVPDEAMAGERIEVSVGADQAGEAISVWFYSEPVDLGWQVVDAEGTVSVTVPADAELGEHRVVVYDDEAALFGWDAITIVEPDDGGGGDGDGGGSGDGDADGGSGDGSAGAGGFIPGVGNTASQMLLYVALLLLILGGAVLWLRRGLHIR